LYYRNMKKGRNQIYDELLIVRCRLGDSAAFNELVGRWQGRLWHYAYRVTGSESAAWDIVQETWYGVIKGIRKLDDVSVFPRWVFRIANNKCVDRLRKQRQQKQLNKELSRQNQNEAVDEQNIDERTESLLSAIDKLSPQSKALLELRYHEGFEIKQIAEILSVPEGTVKSRLHRTLEKGDRTDDFSKVSNRYFQGQSCILDFLRVVPRYDGRGVHRPAICKRYKGNALLGDFLYDWF
jgi:RNA polymerase sigma-70 factor (ECF subfamily)